MSSKSIRHRKKFMDGKMTPRQLHARTAWAGQTCLCGAEPAIRIRVYYPLAELKKSHPHLLLGMAAKNPDGPFVPTYPTTNGPMVPVGQVFACSQHQKEAEIQAARAPSWALAEIDRGPGPERPFVQVLPPM